MLNVAEMVLERVIDTDLYSGVHGLARDWLGRIWVTAECNQCIVVIDPDTCAIQRSVYSETRCHFLCPSRDGRVTYSAHKEVPYIGFHDAESCKMVEKIDLNIGSQAICHAPDCDVLYAGDFARPRFQVVDTATHKVIQSVPPKGVPGWLYATPNGKTIVVTTYLAEENRGFAEVFGTATLEHMSSTHLPAERFHVSGGNDERSVLIVVGGGCLVRMDLATGALDAQQYPLGAEMCG